jgi:hypothetical protein
MSRGDIGYIDLAISLIISLAVGVTLLTGTKDLMKGPEGLNLNNQAINELTTQVVNSPFQHGYDADNLIKIYLDQDHITVTETKTVRITYQLSPNVENNSGVYWNSQDPSIASVDQNGIVTGVKVGDTIVTATTESGVQAKCYVHVNPLVTLFIDPTSYKIYVGDTCQISYTVKPADAPDKHVDWHSENDGIASVDSNGLVTGVAPGTITITGTTNSKTTASCTVTVEKKPPPDYMWTSEHYDEDTRTGEACSSFGQGQSGGGYFYSNRDAGGNAQYPTVHDIYNFSAPTLFKAGTVFRFIYREYNYVPVSFFINGNSIDFYCDSDAFYCGNRIYHASYQLMSDTYISNVEFRGVSSAYSSDPEYGVYIFVTPPGKNTFCLDSSGTSLNQNYNDAYFIGSTSEDEGEADYYIRDTYFVFMSTILNKWPIKIHFARPKAISYISFDEQLKDYTTIHLILEDINRKFSSREIHVHAEKARTTFYSSDFSGIDLSSIVNMEFYVEDANTYNYIYISPTVHFTDGTSLPLGTRTAMPVWQYW